MRASVLMAAAGSVLLMLPLVACDDNGGHRRHGRNTSIDQSGTVNRNDNCYDRHGDWNGRCDDDSDRRAGSGSRYDQSGTVNRQDDCYDRKGRWNGRCDDDDHRRRDRDWFDRLFD